ncbi:hypothetical protein TI05_04975 [Achromatium sp. WMS3]|nr:hypothetical protein TI05_04975 [Achromatium sp. WMS3]
MLPIDLITLERIELRLKIASKKSLLQKLGKLLTIGSTNLSPDLVFDQLLARERLGSTGLGRGIALPHTRIKSLDCAIGAFVQLQKGIAFDAIDNLPVDIAFALLVPQNATAAHLQILAKLASIFENIEICDQLRNIETKEHILAVFQNTRLPN